MCKQQAGEMKQNTILTKVWCPVCRKASETRQLTLDILVMLVILVLKRLRQENHELGVHNEPKSRSKKTSPYPRKIRAEDLNIHFTR